MYGSRFVVLKKKIKDIKKMVDVASGGTLGDIGGHIGIIKTFSRPNSLPNISFVSGRHLFSCKKAVEIEPVGYRVVYPLTPDVTRRLLEDVLSALAFLHEVMNCVHRQLRGTNVIQVCSGYS